MMGFEVLVTSYIIAKLSPTFSPDVSESALVVSCSTAPSQNTFSEVPYAVRLLNPKPYHLISKPLCTTFPTSMYHLRNQGCTE